MRETTAFGERLRLLREDAGLSQQELADRCGLTRVTVSNLERSTSHPTKSSLTALADGLGVTVDALRDQESSLGTRVVLLRKALGMSQQELADRCGLTRVTVSYIEHSRTIPQETSLVALAHALGTTVAALRGEQPVPSEETPEVRLQMQIVVSCERCGPVATVTDWVEAERIRARHAIPHPS